MDTDRRSFLRTACASGICGCFGAAAGTDPAYAATERRLPDGEPEASPQQAQEDALPRAWIAALLPALAAGTDRATAGRVLKAAAAAHWEHLGMAEKVAPFQGNLDALLEFLRKEWGWLIERPEPGVVIADENRSKCVCPLLRGATQTDLSVLCNCSEGFAERLFGTVLGHPVRAQVAQSILRGAPSCRYRITLAPGAPGGA